MWRCSQRISHEPLVDDETFVAVQGLRVAKPAKDGAVRRYRLAGLVVCRLRGRRMRGYWVQGVRAIVRRVAPMAVTPVGVSVTQGSSRIFPAVT